MGNKKLTLTTIGLFLLIMVLIGAIFLISLRLKEEGQDSTAVSLIKTKAAEKTYSKDIFIRPTNTSLPTRDVIGFISLTPTAIMVTPTKYAELTSIPTSTPTEEATFTITPTPTEIIVALNRSASVTIAPTHSYLSPTPTVIIGLPSAGYFSYSLIFFIVAGLILVASFVF